VVKVDQEVQEQLQVLTQLQQLMLVVVVVVEIILQVVHHQVNFQEMVEPVVVEMVEIDHQLDLQE
tara:strand:- start:27 stop:221 length:195 start_codon:yes stop_codon:yes gene_type:complete